MTNVPDSGVGRLRFYLGLSQMLSLLENSTPRQGSTHLLSLQRSGSNIRPKDPASIGPTLAIHVRKTSKRRGGSGSVSGIS
jgi:hypothetical protein